MTSVQTLHRYDEPRVIDEPAVRFGLAGFALFAAVGVVSAVHPPAALGVLALAGVAMSLSAVLNRPSACGIGIAGWAFAEGFALHDYGQLRLTQPDLWLLAVFVLACLATSVLRRQP
ncbi:hypothetical protein [Nocardioides sp. WS12]|uniref:hypothetical protein n=1 Tax=Nocardioides sp. WS12 TaxID=2486272 RepID=UPI0015F96A74|nr:hypothetical protein [Nocardioides sp. WS12]